ncbi:MAG: PAS domain S-box protein, partial [Lentisphaerota bacterium]
RRVAIYGWVYSPYRMNDLMRGIFGGLSLEKKKDFHFEVFDGGNPSPQNLLHKNFPEENRAQRSPVRFTRQISHIFNGETWTLCFTQTGGGFYTAEYAKMWFFLIGSTLVSLLLFALVLTLLNISDKAQQLAEKLTVDLREKTSILSGLLTSIPDMVFFKNKEGVYLGCNPEFARFANRDIPDIVGSTDYDLFDKELADFFRTQDCIMMEHNMPRHNEEWVQYPDGARVLLDTAKAPLMDADGRVLGLLGVGRDITDLKRETMKLQNISDRLALAVRAGGVGIWDWDVVNNCVIWDEQMFRLYGTASDKFTSTYEVWLAGLHPDDRQRSDEEIRLALSGEKEFNTEFRVLWPDGTICHISCLAIVQRDAAGQPLHMLGTNWDITAQKLVEKKLLEKEEEIHLLLDSTAEAIYGLDINGNCTFCNSACLRLLGYTLPGELLGKNMHWQIHSKHPDGSHFPVKDCRIYQAFKKGERLHVDDEVLWRADGSSFPVEYWSVPQHNEGVLVGAVMTFVDITNRKHLEAEKAKLEARNRQLQKAESLGRMSGAIAHHFNNKLNVVMGYLEMVIADLPPDDSHAVKLARAMQAAQKASEVSGNLLAYLGQIRNKVESLDLSEICTVSLPVLLA